MNAKLLIATVGITAALAVAATGLYSNENLSATAAQTDGIDSAQAPADASGDILVFQGAQEDLSNVAFTIKPAVGALLVYRSRPAGGAKPVLSLRTDAKHHKGRIVRGVSSAKKDMLFSVIYDRNAENAYLVGTAAGSNVLKASFTVDRSGKRICSGYTCRGGIAYSWAGAPGLDRLWLYNGTQTSGLDNVRFTIRGPLGEAMALMPVLAGMN